MTKITLIVTGSIAAYKSAELVRSFKKNNYAVQVVMTRAATEFITPLTMQVLSGNRVSLDLFDLVAEAEIGHIKIADESDLIVVAPATANIIAKYAHGIADDIATTILLAATCPVLVAPAMNVNMWNHLVTQQNVTRLKERGVRIVDPECGSLACGWEGNGRLADLEVLLAAVKERLLFDNK